MKKMIMSVILAAAVSVSAFSVPAAAQTAPADINSVTARAVGVGEVSLHNDHSTDKKITLEWYYYGDTPTDGFQVMYRPASGKSWKKKTVKNCAVSITGLKKATKYRIKVRAYKKNGDGTVSYGKFAAANYYTLSLNYAKFDSTYKKWNKKLGGYSRLGFTDINNDNIPELAIHAYTAEAGHRMVFLTYNNGKPEKIALLKGYSDIYRKGKKYYTIKTETASGGKCTLIQLKLKGNKLTKKTIYSGSASYDKVYGKYLKNSTPTCFNDSCLPSAFNKSYFHKHKPWKEGYGNDAFEG